MDFGFRNPKVLIVMAHHDVSMPANQLVVSRAIPSTLQLPNDFCGQAVFTVFMPNFWIVFHESNTCIQVSVEHVYELLI